MKSIVYISGPMKGYPESNYSAFHAAAKHLREMGYTVISPAEVELSQYPVGYIPKDEVDENEMYNAFMRADIKFLMDADIIAVLPGWEKSKGAKIEVRTALDLGIGFALIENLEAVE